MSKTREDAEQIISRTSCHDCAEALKSAQIQAKRVLRLEEALREILCPGEPSYQYLFLLAEEALDEADDIY